MGNTGFRGLIISLLLVGLFAIALINGGILLAALNSPNQTIANDAAIMDYASELNSTLEDVYTDANSSETSFTVSPLTTTTSIPFVDAVGGIWKTLKKTPTTVWNLSVNYIFIKIFGSAAYAIVFGVISAIMLIIIIFAVWEWISTGRAGGDQ